MAGASYCTHSDETMDKEADKQENSGIYTGDLERKKRWYSPSADVYEAVRPQYSRKLIAHAVEHAHLTAASHLLEIGCGPGTVTTALASHGIWVTCLEPNQIFFRIARHNCRTFPNVIVHNLALEQWPITPKSFDAVMAASAFHWVTADVAYSKAAAALVDGGYLVLLWNMALLPPNEVNKILLPVYGRHDVGFIHPEAESLETQDLNITKFGENIIDSGLFKDLTCYSETVRVTYSVDDYLLLLSTYSKYLALPPEIRNKLFHDMKKVIVEQFGENLDLTYKSACHVARKAS